MYFVFIKGNIASQEKSSMEQLYIGAQSYSARLVLLLARFSRSQQLAICKKIERQMFQALALHHSQSGNSGRSGYLYREGGAT